MRDRLSGLLATLVVLPYSLSAQTPSPPPPDSGNVTLLDITVHPGEYEPHIVFLQKGIVYRASFSGKGVEIRLRSFQGRQLPFVVALSNDVDATGGSEYELYPQSDGDVEFTEVFNAEKVPVTFRLWKDARSTERGRRSAEEGFWELGVDGLVGRRGNFSPQAGGSGTTFGGCLSVRNGPGVLGWLNGCILGAEGLTGQQGVFFFFSEPEIRLSNGRRTDAGWKNEWGLVARVNIFADGGDGNYLDEGHFGNGAYFARDQRDLNGRGWRLTLIVRADNGQKLTLDAFGNVTKREQAWAPAIQLGVGRYH